MLDRRRIPISKRTLLQHWSSRKVWDRRRSLWGGYAVISPHARFWFEEVGRELGPFDCASIPVGAYNPRDFMQAQHVTPEEAVQIHQVQPAGSPLIS